MSELLTTLKHKSLPTIYRLRENLFAACFWLMKLGVAFEILDEAINRRQIRNGSLIVESTSGTMGYGLALVGHAMGMRVELVADPVIDPVFEELLGVLGARVHIVHEHLDVGGYQIPRLRRVDEILNNNPGAYWPRQYENAANPRSYAKTAKLIASTIPRVDILVAPVGSGGSISGTTETLRRLGHPARAVAVDTHGSILFGQKDLPRKLRGLGNSILPPNVNYSLIDEVHWVEAADALCATRHLFSNHGLDMGPTTGAAFLVADFLALKFPEKAVVFLGPDRAERYLASAYSKRWCADNGLLVENWPVQPYQIADPADAHGGWSFMAWNGRPIKDLMAGRDEAAA